MSTPRAFAILSLSFALAALAVGRESARAEIVLTSIGPITETFDSLPSSNPTGITFLDNGTHVALGSTGFDGAKYAGDLSDPVFLADNGSSGTTTNYSYGSAGPPVSTDRALGSVSTSANRMAFGFALRNDTAETITSITVSFNQESWRRGSDPNTTDASWATSDSSPTATLTNYLTSAPSFVDVNTFDLTLLGGGSGGVGPLDGNLLANRVAKSFTFTGLSLTTGERFFLRWRDREDTGSDAGLAIDDMAISFAVVPEPSAFLFGALACGVAGLGYVGRKIGGKPTSSLQAGLIAQSR